MLFCKGERIYILIVTLKLLVFQIFIYIYFFCCWNRRCQEQKSFFEKNPSCEGKRLYLQYFSIFSTFWRGPVNSIFEGVMIQKWTLMFSNYNFLRRFAIHRDFNQHSRWYTTRCLKDRLKSDFAIFCRNAWSFFHVFLYYYLKKGYTIVIYGQNWPITPI